MKRSSPGQQFIQHHTQAENVTAAIDPMAFTTGLFRTHVSGCPSVFGAVALVLFLERQAEIDDEWLTACVQHDVAGLHVSMNQCLAVSIVQRLGYCGDQ